MPTETTRIRTGSYPLMNLAEDYGLPLSVVYPYADSCRRVILDNLAGKPMLFDDVRHIEAYGEAATRLDEQAFLMFHEAVGVQVLGFLKLQGYLPRRFDVTLPR